MLKQISKGPFTCSAEPKLISDTEYLFKETGRHFMSRVDFAGLKKKAANRCFLTDLV